MVVGSEFKFSVEGIQKFQQVLRTRSLVIVGWELMWCPQVNKEPEIKTTGGLAF